MRELIFGTILVGAAGAGVYFMPITAGEEAQGYALSLKDAKQRLGAADLRRGKEPFGRLDVMVTMPSHDVIAYTGTGSFAAIECRVKLKAVGGDRVTASPSCDRQAMDGAAASAAKDMTDLAFAEFVDAALEGRAYDDEKIRMQSAGAVLRNMPQMQKEALKMQREMGEMQQDWENEEAAADFMPEEADYSADYAAE